MQNEFLKLQSMLHKTIVFITHDFDEAIRLADRIAIMYEGGIVQIGTAEELITNPATDYVAEFTKDIPRAKLLTLNSLANKSDLNVYSMRLSSSEKIINVSEKILKSEGNISVIDSNNNIIGSINKDKIIEILFEK